MRRDYPQAAVPTIDLIAPTLVARSRSGGLWTLGAARGLDAGDASPANVDTTTQITVNKDTG